VAPESLSRAFVPLRPLGIHGHGHTVSIKGTTGLRAFREGREYE